MSAAARRQSPKTIRAETIRAVLPDLVQPRQQIEATFVAIGSRLSQGAVMLNRVTKVFEALPRELESPQLLQASAKIGAIGQQAEIIAEAFVLEQTDLGRLLGVVAAAEQPISELRRTVKMMGIVAINARVVAAGIVGDSDEFAVFTTDIATLSDSANRTIQEFSTLYRQLVDEVGHAAEQREHFESAHAHTLSGLAGSMSGTLAAVTAQRQSSIDGSAETSRVSRQIASSIGSAVISLQVGDATRQRIEHIEAGLQMLADLVDPAGHDALPEAAHDNAVAVIAGLQAAQLASAAEAFEADIGQAIAAMQDLAGNATTVMARSQDIYGPGTAGAQSPLSALNTQMRHAAAVLGDCEVERGKLALVATAVQGTVRALLGNVEAVQEIEANMRLVSLNAAVKCAQLGPRGTALNVIAKQLRELTGETVSAAEAAMTGLREAAELAQSFSAASSGDAARQVGQLEQDAIAALGLLEAVDTTLAQAFAILNQDGPRVIALLTEAADGIIDQGAIFKALGDAQCAISALVTDAGATPDAGLNDPLQRLRSSYTMDGERRIHDARFGSPIDSPQPSAEPSETELDAMFF